MYSYSVCVLAPPVTKYRREEFTNKVGYRRSYVIVNDEYNRNSCLQEKRLLSVGIIQFLHY